jgi:hypothetical protein
MKSLLTIFMLLALCNSNCYSQEKVITGEIKDFENKTLLQYVNIGIENKGVGTVSNSNGIFSLKLNEKIKENDTITFSHIGYKTKKIVLTELTQSNNSIELQPETNNLNEIVVKFVKPKPKKFGRSSKGLGLMHCNFYSYYEKNVDDRLSKEIGMKFKLKKDCKINDLNFNVTSNEFKSLKFRLNFYKIENSLPSKIIVEKDIIFEIKDGFLGWYNLDLKLFEIYLDKEMEDIAVTIQWIESVKMNEKSKYFSISTAMSTTETSFFREKAMDNWKKNGQSLSFYLNTMCK